MTDDAHSTLTLDELRARRDEILDVARRHGAVAVWVFGSVARGEADESSDVDLLVDVEEGTSLLDLAELYADLTDLLGRPVDVGTRRSLKTRIKDRVLAEAVPL